MKEVNNTHTLGVTFQMSLDTFLEEVHPIKNKNIEVYTIALQKLEEGKKVRSFVRKQEFAKEALQLCPDCIEAHMTLGWYESDYIKKIHYFKTGMELATMNLGKDFFLSEQRDFYECEEAKPYFHIKFAYAEALFEVGFMRKALGQFQELLKLNPSDVFHVHHYLYTLYLYFEELEACKQLLERYDSKETIDCYVHFLYALKMEDYQVGDTWIPKCKIKNQYLFDYLTYRAMNTIPLQKEFHLGSEAEAGYVYHMLSKVIQTMDYLHIYLVNHETILNK